MPRKSRTPEPAPVSPDAVSPAPGAPDVNTLLPPEALAALRGGYDRQRMVDDVRTTLEVAYSPAIPVVEAVLATFYVPRADGTFQMDPAARERVVLALLSNGAGAGFDVAVHTYWAMMEGLAPSEVLDVLILTANYGGVSRYTDNFKIFMQVVIPLLNKRDAKGKVDCSSVVAALSEAFPVGKIPKR